MLPKPYSTLEVVNNMILFFFNVARAAAMSSLRRSSFRSYST